MHDQPTCRCGCGEITGHYRHTDRKRGWVKGSPIPYVNGHAPGQRLPLEERYRVEVRGYKTPCWVWLHGFTSNGYGLMKRPKQRVPSPAHRVFYERFVGPIPEGMQLDHLCRVPACVNPEHLEPVTASENIRRAPATKLTREKVIEIHRMRERGDTYAVIAEAMGITFGMVGMIVRGKSWRDVYDELYRPVKR